MVFFDVTAGQGTATDFDPGIQRRKDLAKEERKADRAKKRSCESRGGKWDAETRQCIGALREEPLTFGTFKPEEERTKTPEATTGPGIDRNQFGDKDVKLTEEERAGMEKGDRIRTDRFGNETIQTRSDAEWEAATRGQITAVEASEILAEAEARGEQFAGQTGQFGELGLRKPGMFGEFDLGEASIVGLRTSIPAAIGGAATIYGITAGLAAAKTGAIAGSLVPGVGTAIGAGLGFAAGIVGGMLANMNSQRTDTTNAQQRVLDEGKQTLADWRTLAEANPARRQEALAGFNMQLALIDRAYRQMKLDTNADVLKFETALPNLAEFEAFYNRAGERDFLVAEMRLALSGPLDINHAMMELSHRRAITL